MGKDTKLFQPIPVQAATAPASSGVHPMNLMRKLRRKNMKTKNKTTTKNIVLSWSPKQAEQQEKVELSDVMERASLSDRLMTMSKVCDALSEVSPAERKRILSVIGMLLE